MKNDHIHEKKVERRLMLCLFCPGITKAKSISISCIFVICYNDFWHTIPDYINLLSYWSLQVVKPVNLEAMSKWVGSIPDDVVEDMANIAPMLAKMGYDPNGNPPKYGDPDPEVLRNTNDVKEHNDVWEAKGEMVKSLSKKNEGKWNAFKEQKIWFKSFQIKKWLWLYFKNL